MNINLFLFINHKIKPQSPPSFGQSLGGEDMDDSANTLTELPPAFLAIESLLKSATMTHGHQNQLVDRHNPAAKVELGPVGIFLFYFSSSVCLID
jgi:hypothetical protein